jgi:hypothetical protein
VIFGASEREKAGRQHSSRIVSWTRSAQPLEFGRPALMKRWRAPSWAAIAFPKSFDLNSEPLSVVISLSFQSAAFSSAATRWTSSAVVAGRGVAL